VDTHRRKIMEKMECGSIAELTRLAIREGLVDLT
ncbi:MAG: DNA-binding response regulator, partial [Synergistales bacterium]|nr:DNA-binding response regulator [Synergistales bacterium]